MSDDAAAAPPKKKGGKIKKIALLGGGAALLLGGGAAAGMYASGMGLAGHQGPVEDPNMPKLVLKDGTEEHGVAEHKGKEDDIPANPGKYKASYFNIEQNFTSNLRDSDGFVQVALGVSTYYDQRVVDRLKEHEMAIRSAVLLDLADQDAFVISTPEGKTGLQKKLKDTINDVLRKKEGFGGIADVYFTSFIIQ